jgi:hypothetical protein
MTVRRGTAIVSTALATAFAVALATSGPAETAKPSRQTSTRAATPTTSRAHARERPRGVVEDCPRIRGVMASREFTKQRNLILGPLALLHAGRTLAYVDSGDEIGNKVFVLVRGGHRVTLELSQRTRRGAGLGFGPYPDGEVHLGSARRVVTFIACRRGEYPYRPPPDGWPVSGWVGFLLARSPRCVPLLVWVDHEPSPRRAVIRFGVTSCG